MKMAVHSYHSPVRVLYGQGAVRAIGKSLAEIVPGASRVLVVTDRGVEGAGIAGVVLDELRDAGIEADTVVIAAEPTEEEVREGARLLQRQRPAAIVGVGGGSALDAAKAINVAAHNSSALQQYEGFDLVPNGGLPLVTVPTTAGTGSEVGSGFVITDKATRRKYLVIDRKCWPALAILDPELTVTLPPTATAYSGIDALAQAMGAYVVTLAHPFMEPMSVGAVRLLYQNIVRAVEEGSDIVARSNLQLGSAMAGFAMYNSECACDHAFGEVAGGFYGIPHGLCIAMFLPYTTAYNVPAATAAYARLARAMEPGLHGLADEAACSELVRMLQGLNQRFGVPSLAELGGKDDDIPELVSRTLEHFSMTINPRPFRIEEIEAIYRQVMNPATAAVG